jgi:hypothetical protein
VGTSHAQSTNEIEALLFPLIGEDQASDVARALFGESITGGVFVPNPEFPGGNIALVEVNNNKVH